MRSNTRTAEFRHRIVVGNGRLTCAETTMGEISAKTLEHPDENKLVRK